MRDLSSEQVDNQEEMAKRFEANRGHLRAIAARMLGSQSEADDAVQEAWLRLSRTSGIENFDGWLITVTARICLDILRARKARQEEPLDANASASAARRADGSDPEQEALLSESVGLALMAILDRLAPAERVAFVLHDFFEVPFDEIATIVERSPAATRQLASRARRRMGGAATVSEAARLHRNDVVDAFLAASRGGDFAALLAVLDPDIVLRADSAAVKLGASSEVRGAEAVARIYFGRAQAAQPARVNGEAGLVWAPTGPPRVAFIFTITRGKIAAIDLVADPLRLQQIRLVIKSA